LESVREALYTPPGNYEHLRGLEWAIGEWVLVTRLLTVAATVTVKLTPSEI
jgi:hypothetical protein